MRRSLLTIFTLVIIGFHLIAAVTVNVNGTNHTIPEVGETGWGTNVTNWIVDISADTFQKKGGSFPLTADANFGSSFGLEAAHFTSSTASSADAGAFRLAGADAVAWRNAADSGNLLLDLNSDVLEFNGVALSTVSGTETLTNKTLTSPVINTSVSGTAILDEDDLVSDSATQLATQQSIKAYSDNSISTHAALTTTHGVSGDLVGTTDTQTLSAKTLTSPVLNTGVSGTAVLDEDNMVSDSATQLATQQSIKAYADTKTAKSTLTTKGDIYAASAASTPARLPVGTNGQVLTADSSQSTGLSWTTIAGSNLSVTTKTAAYTVTTSDDVILGDTSSAAFTLTLPTAVGNTGKVFYIKKVDGGANILTIDGSGTETIDGELTQALNGDNDGIALSSDGANYTLIGAVKEKNKVQTKTLGFNVTSDVTISDLTFNNLEIGRWYEVRGNIRLAVNSGAADNAVSVVVSHNSATLDLKTLLLSDGTTSLDISTHAVSFVFQAEATSLTFVASNASANSYVAGAGNRSETYIQLEERNDLIGTTQF